MYPLLQTKYSVSQIQKSSQQIMYNTHKRNFFVMDEKTKEQTVSEIKRDQIAIPQQYPNFVATMQNYFPSSILMSEFFYLSNEITSSLGFTDENTMGMAALCRDEITEGCLEQVVRYWGKTFNCCSLSAMITIGKTGLGASTAHCPFDKQDGINIHTLFCTVHMLIYSNYMTINAN